MWCGMKGEVTKDSKAKGYWVYQLWSKKECPFRRKAKVSWNDVISVQGIEVCEVKITQWASLYIYEFFEFVLWNVHILWNITGKI